MSTAPITYFDGTAYDFLSNFHRSPFDWTSPWGTPYVMSTVEHAFQAEKCIDPAEYRQVVHARSPGQAKTLGRSAQLRSDWEERKFDLMEALLVLKFQIPRLRRQLLKTGNALLIEGNVWHDNIWGDCQCHRCEDVAGANHLGLLLMRVRDSIREEVGE